MAFVNRGPSLFFKIHNKLISNNIEGTQNNMELLEEREPLVFKEQQKQPSRGVIIKRCS